MIEDEFIHITTLSFYISAKDTEDHTVLPFSCGSKCSSVNISVDWASLCHVRLHNNILMEETNI
jgi:hypothetical protein